MKLRNLIIFVSVLLIANALSAQVIITKYDSIPFGNDSIFKIVLLEVRGSFLWQQSFDLENWSTSNSNEDTLVIHPEVNTYYRARIVDGSCDPFYSDTIIVKTGKTVKFYTDEIIEVAYKDSVGELVKFFNDEDTIVCRKINNEYVFQGDIILTEEQVELLNKEKGAGIPLKDSKPMYYLWPENKVYYEIDEKLKDDQRIIDAMKHWEQNTNIRFIQRKDEYCFVKFVWSEKDCSSQLGMIIRVLPCIGQKIKIPDNADSGHVIHEVGHTVGLLHEHSRNDRDSYVIYFEENVIPEKRYNFEKYPNSINTEEFDFSSTMLYSSYSFAIKGLYTMIKKDTGEPFPSQRGSLSLGDIEIVNKLYPSISQLLLSILSTSAITNITQTTATSGGNITSDGGAAVTIRGVCWSTSQNPTIANSKTTNGTEIGSFVSNLTGLTANTTYYVRAYATNSHGTAYGNEVTFTTGQEIGLPVLTTTAITSITQITATSGGNITSDGGANVTARGVCWSTGQNPTTANSKTTNGTGTGIFTSNLTGLIANTPYYVRAYATNSKGTAYGNEVTFTTGQEIGLPVLTTTAITSITQITATSGGNITSDGGAAVIARGVCWSTSQTPTIANSKTTNGTGIGSFVSNLTGLTANTPYYVRAYATNSAGTAYGNEVTFTTGQEIGLPVLTTTAITEITQTTATSGGNITSDGGATVTARGVCWSTSQNPTIANSKTTNGTGTGIFTSNLTGLTTNTNYYVRAYATNSKGTAYGNEVTFKTIGNDSIDITADFPDPSFLALVRRLLGKGANDPIYSTDNFPSILSLDFTELGVYTVKDLSGLQHFKALKTLLCPNGALTSIPVLPPSLSELICFGNRQLTTLPTLPSGLNRLNCGGNQLTSLPDLPSALTFIDCGYNNLKTLPALSSNLKYIQCEYNQLTSLPDLPSGLTNLGCWNNKLSTLPALPSSLTQLACMNNQLTSLPILPLDLDQLSCEGNQLTSLPTLPSGLDYLHCPNNQLSSLPILPSNMRYLYCGGNRLTSLPILPSDLNQLICDSNLLITLPELPNNLLILDCSNNQLSSLPLLPLSLGRLECDYNKLTELALNSETSYGYIDVRYNYLRGEEAVTGQDINWVGFISYTYNLGLYFYPQYELPVVSTGDLTNITNKSSTSGGNITTDGGFAITARGVCWSINKKPTIDNNKTIDGNGTGSFISNITGLSSNTPYYVRAYATNNKGTAYGNEVTFTTTAAEDPVYGSFTDPRDGHVYKTVTIGEQVWMAENLAYLPEVSPPTEGSNTDPFYYVIGNDGTSVTNAKQNANYSTYGVLYNRPAAMAACPPGWHLPKLVEWTALENYLIANGFNYDGTTFENRLAKSLAAKTHWSLSSTTGAIGSNLSANNSSGFSALPGGQRNIYTNAFENVGTDGYWWSSNQDGALNTYFRNLNFNNIGVSSWLLPDAFGLSVRCVKD